MDSNRVEIYIQIRGPIVVAINPDGSETVIGTWEHLVRSYLGEFSVEAKD
jgi:hypothetical protein